MENLDSDYIHKLKNRHRNDRLYMPLKTRKLVNQGEVSKPSVITIHALIDDIFIQKIGPYPLLLFVYEKGIDIQSIYYIIIQDLNFDERDENLDVKI